MGWAPRLYVVKKEVPQTPVQGSGAHEPLLSREATSHSLTAMLVWSSRLKMWTQRVLHVRTTSWKVTVRWWNVIVRVGQGVMEFCQFPFFFFFQTSYLCRWARTRIESKWGGHHVSLLRSRTNSGTETGKGVSR